MGLGAFHVHGVGLLVGFVMKTAEGTHQPGCCQYTVVGTVAASKWLQTQRAVLNGLTALFLLQAHGVLLL